jgi:hypothetical protein
VAVRLVTCRGRLREHVGFRRLGKGVEEEGVQSRCRQCALCNAVQQLAQFNSSPVVGLRQLLYYALSVLSAPARDATIHTVSLCDSACFFDAQVRHCITALEGSGMHAEDVLEFV